MSPRRCSNTLWEAPVVPSKMKPHHLDQKRTTSSPYQLRINYDFGSFLPKVNP
ncbi:hypothetical protein N9127_01500 [Akkermansiaceae bacterium]|nr:hypothetical protein [Akkermansiaceae bacterium]